MTCFQEEKLFLLLAVYNKKFEIRISLTQNNAFCTDYILQSST